MTLNNPALQLSEEAQDLILDLVRGDSTPALAQATFHAFCLVSRRWLNSGRRALYYQPSMQPSVCWDSADKLLASVQGNPVLGASVRHLDALAAQSKTLHNARRDMQGGIVVKRGNGWQWAIDMVAACHNLQAVGVHLASAKHAHRLAKALPLRIKALTLQSPREGEFSLSDLHQWLRVAEGSLSGLGQLTAGSFHWPPSTTPSNGPDFAYPIHTLTLDNFKMTVPQMQALIPSTPSLLRRLTLRTRISFSRADAVLLLSAVVPTLEHLSFTSLWADKSTRQILPEEYAEADGHVIPLELLSPLPELKSIHVKYTTAMSIGKLASLAGGSPKLEHITLRGTTWQFDAPPFSLTPTQAFTLAKPKIVDIARDSFPVLKSLHLGLVPVSSADPKWMELPAVATLRGVRITLEKCKDPAKHYRCDQCQALHDC